MSSSNTPRPRSGLFRLALALALALMAGLPSQAAGPFRTNDVVAFVGGSAVVANDQFGALETILTLLHPGHRLRFRSLAWEGDTVFQQPRELNFPPLTRVLSSAQATVACVQFGALESFAGPEGLEAFRIAYGNLLDALRAATPRLLVITPPPFEGKPAPLPDLAARNPDLSQYAAAARSVAEARNIPVIDLFQALSQNPPQQGWTVDGREPSPAGHRAIAGAWARDLGYPALAERLKDPRFWERPDLLALQGAVRSKNRLWFDYWRPMNWAFLAGDRTEQQSSRDHLDPKIRWFPSEMEQFVPLIAEAEIRIESLATQTHLGP